MNEKLIDIYRRDFTNSLVHLSRERTVLTDSGKHIEEKAFDNLKSILKEGVIKGGSGFILVAYIRISEYTQRRSNVFSVN